MCLTCTSVRVLTAKPLVCICACVCVCKCLLLGQFIQIMMAFVQLSTICKIRRVQMMDNIWKNKCERNSSWWIKAKQGKTYKYMHMHFRMGTHTQVCVCVESSMIHKHLQPFNLLGRVSVILSRAYNIVHVHLRPIKFVCVQIGTIQKNRWNTRSVIKLMVLLSSTCDCAANDVFDAVFLARSTVSTRTTAASRERSSDKTDAKCCAAAVTTKSVYTWDMHRKKANKQTKFNKPTYQPTFLSNVCFLLPFVVCKINY